MITLLTDFGTADYFVGAMKGVILSINPEARIFDITHEIPPQDIAAGAFTLNAVYQNFPAGTIHIAVVDPGVGSRRRAILAKANHQFFVGPDNGLFSFIYERHDEARVYHLTNENYFRQPVSATFHGRDVFAPVGAALSLGVAAEELGNEVTEYARLPDLSPKMVGEGKIEASIIHIDRFGNCVTNLTREHVTDEMIARGVSLQVCGREITSFRQFFAEGAEGVGHLFAIWGSAGYLEICAFRASAAQALNARTGQQVIVTGDK